MNSLADFGQLYLERGEEIAFVHRRGYRSISWSYRQVAELAFRFAGELAAFAAKWPCLELENLSDILVKNPATIYDHSALVREDTAQIVFTSGTTAEPRGVVLTHGNLLASLDPIQREIPKYLKYERIFHPIRFLNMLPLSHVFGQYMGTFIPCLIGGTVIFQDSFKPSEVIDSIGRD